VKKPKKVVITFEELVAQATLGIHAALLEGGGKGMRGAVHMWLARAIEWRAGDGNVVQAGNTQRAGAILKR
jgi:hypothetical protein